MRAVATLAALAALAGCAADGHPEAAASGSGHAVVAAAPSDASDTLLAGIDERAGHLVADACAVSFTATGVADPAPRRETQGRRFGELPVPRRDGEVFAGWYATPAAAAALDASQRVNGARIVACRNRKLELHGAWETAQQFRSTPVHVPILMYHWFTRHPDGEHVPRRANYVYAKAFDEQLAYIAHGGFYLPTWDELEEFIDGRLALPKRSVIITDDDAAPSWFSIGVPIVNRYHLLVTSFVITKSHAWPSPSIWVQERSHTNDLHRVGADGKGLMVDLPAATVAADLERSAAILGAKQVLAYPLGDYDATAERALREAGFDMAVTTRPGSVTPGAAKLELPRVPVRYGMTVTDLAAAIG